MAADFSQEDINNLKAEIIFYRAKYDQSIKNDKLLKESKAIFKQLKELENRLQLMLIKKTA